MAEEDKVSPKNNPDIGNRRSPLSNNLMYMLGDLLQPQTTGFDHINMDMSFSYIPDEFSKYRVENSSFIIVWCQLWGLKKPMFIERNNLATHLISNRSIKGKSMGLFTETVTHQKHEFVDKTEQKGGFSFLGKKKQTEGSNQ